MNFKKKHLTSEHGIRLKDWHHSCQIQAYKRTLAHKDYYGKGRHYYYTTYYNKLVVSADYQYIQVHQHIARPVNFSLNYKIKPASGPKGITDQIVAAVDEWRETTFKKQIERIEEQITDDLFDMTVKNNWGSFQITGWRKTTERERELLTAAEEKVKAKKLAEKVKEAKKAAAEKKRLEYEATRVERERAAEAKRKEQEKRRIEREKKAKLAEEKRQKELIAAEAKKSVEAMNEDALLAIFEKALANKGLVVVKEENLNV